MDKIIIFIHICAAFFLIVNLSRCVFLWKSFDSPEVMAARIHDPYCLEKSFIKSLVVVSVTSFWLIVHIFF